MCATLYFVLNVLVNLNKSEMSHPELTKLTGGPVEASFAAILTEACPWIT